jgi:hypothetical protein
MKTLIWSLIFSLVLVSNGMNIVRAQQHDEDDGPDKAREEQQLLLEEPKGLQPVEPPFELPNGPILTTPTGFVRRYLVTYMKSRDDRSATVVTVTNQSKADCRVQVEWQVGFSTGNVCATTLALAPGFTADFCSRGLNSALTTCNSTCNPDLDFHEGKAYVTSACSQIGVSARVYYTQDRDTRVEAITDSKVVRVNSGNSGD